MSESSRTIIMLCYVIIGLLVLHMLLSMWRHSRHRHHGHGHGCRCRDCRQQYYSENFEEDL